MIKKILIFVLFVFLYEFISIVSPNHLIPSLTEILKTLIEELRQLDIYIDIISSVEKVLVGFLLASFFGIILGILIANINKLRLLNYLIDILRPIPPIAWIPIAILFLGIGNISSYFIVFIGSFFPIFTSVYFGTSSIPQIYKNVAKNYELGKWKYYRYILFNFSLPFIFSGLKIGIGMAWMSVIAAELISAQSGLGYYIQINRLLLRTDKIIIGMALIGITGFLLQMLIKGAERKIVKWENYD